MDEGPQHPAPPVRADFTGVFDGHEPDWNPAILDLDAYFARIGYTGSREPTSATLAAIHRAHVAAIPFENIDVALGRGVKTGLADIEAKLVATRRGGYCFEHNPLLAAVLTRLGFGVRRGSARGPMGPEQHSPIRYGMGHAMMVARAEDQSYLCDVGVGYLGASTPVPLVDGAEFVDGAWRYRTHRVTAGPDFQGWMLGLALPTAWSNVYAFSEQPCFAADYADQNFIATDHPASPFPTQLLVQRTGPDDRWSLRDLDLSRRRAGQAAQTRQLRPDELPAVLSDVFGLTLDPETAQAAVAFVQAKSHAAQGRRGI